MKRITTNVGPFYHQSHCPLYDRLPYTPSPTNCMPEANAADCEYWRGLGNCLNE